MSDAKQDGAAKKANDKPPFPGVYERESFSELLTKTYPPNEWIVENLIHSGDQVVLAGPPKIGKSIMATQLALKVASGEGHFISPRFSVMKKKRSVLVFSLEMNAPMVAERLRSIYPKTSKAEERKHPDLPLTFVFSVNEQVSLDVVDFDGSNETKAKKAGEAFLSEHGLMLKKIIAREEPDLVVFDTMIRVHALDENNNVAMSHLLRKLREICTIDEREFIDPSGESTETERRRRRVAHVIIHHTRKESSIGHGPATRDANAVRGAGAIHAEADLVLTLSDAYRSDIVMISTSARRVSLPNAIFARRKGLEFSETARPLGARQTRAGKLADALWRALHERSPQENAPTRSELVQRVAELGYGDLTEDNFRKTYHRKIASFVDVIRPAEGAQDQSNRYRLRASADEESFREALNAPSKLHHQEAIRAEESTTNK